MADFKQITVGGVSHPVKDEVARQGLAGKQDKLTFDDTPTADSNNPVKSGGVFQAIQSIDVSGQISGKEDKSNKVTSFSSPTDTQYPSAKLVNDQLATKQGTISDLSTIRSNAAAGATAYQKPGTGIPKTDLASAVQTSLGKADTAIQSVTVGTTTTGAAGTNASVTNTGTATEPVLSFTIPQGAQGIQGIQGPQGERGLPGESGVTGDVSSFTVIQTIDPSATYGATDIAGAATVQATNQEVTELAGEYTDNPEFVRVVTDAEGRILYGVKTGGEFVFGVGVPKSIKDYVLSQKAEIDADVLAEKTRAIAAERDLGYYVDDSPEFVRVYLDSEDKILFGIQNDGNIVFGAGVPEQIVSYVENKIASLSLDEYEDIVLFIGDLVSGDSLSNLLNSKVDKEDGKGLSSNDYTDDDKNVVDTVSIVENPEYIDVKVDVDDKVLEGITADGKKKINIPLDINGTVVELVDNPEYVKVLTDNDGHIICGVRKDGSIYIAQSNISDELNTRIDGAVEDLNNTIEDVKEELEEDIDNVSAPIFANDAEYNVWRQVQQLRNIKWTPKKTISEGAGTRPAGVEVTDGMPYSSVKECLKYVGIDVSFHTFMTAVNDEHSLFYTEKPLNNNSVSAYGITYHGVNSLCYYGSVCSGLVTTALGSKVQWDSWAFQTIKDKFEILDNQDVFNLKVGDIFSQPGHCGIITKIVRDKNGSIIEWEVDEHSAPIHIGDNHNHMTLTNKTWQTNSVWCRYKELYKNTFYKPNPFVLADSENLYNIGDFVFIETDTTRNYYRCKTANRDSSFIAGHWNAIPAWSANIQYASNYNFSIVSYRDRLYRCVVSHTSSDSFNSSKWVEIKEDANEWAAYPYVYNDDIVTFAGDRAAFRSNDLIYINYKKGDYTQMQLYKDSELYKTYDLPNDDSFQINVSSDCAGAGMYKARLTDGTNYSRYTYFEVIDAQVSATYANGIAELTFSSSNGKPLAAQIVERSGGTLCHKSLTDRDIADGTIQFNPLARLYAERWSNWDGFRNKTDLAMYARVIFEGVYGNVVNEMIYLTTADAITGDVIYPNTPVDLGVISGDRNIILADTMIGNTYIVNFKIGENANVSILSGIGTVIWKTGLPSTLAAGDSYQIKVENGLGNVIKIN